MIFNDTSTRNGLIQECERICLTGVAGISGNSNLLKDFTSRLNQALDTFFTIALSVDERWQFDDFNNTDFPIATTTLQSGVQDYAFDIAFLTIEKVLVKDESGNKIEIPVYQISDPEANKIWTNPTGNSGTPNRAELFANSIFLDPVPNYTIAEGLEVVTQRTADKFVYTDTTAIPGIPVMFHPYLARQASLPYLLEHSMKNAQAIASLIQQDERNIGDWIASRSKTDTPRLQTIPEDNR